MLFLFFLSSRLTSVVIRLLTFQKNKQTIEVVEVAAILSFMPDLSRFYKIEGFGAENLLQPHFYLISDKDNLKLADSLVTVADMLY